MYQEETPTSQLDWYLREPSFYAAKLKILLKKGKKYIQEGDYAKTLITRKQEKLKQQTKGICN